MPSVLNKNVDRGKLCFKCNNYVNFSYKYVVLIGEKEINQPLWSWGGWGINQYFCILFSIPFIDQEWGQDEWILNDCSSILCSTCTAWKYITVWVYIKACLSEKSVFHCVSVDRI